MTTLYSSHSLTYIHDSDNSDDPRVDDENDNTPRASSIKPRPTTQHQLGKAAQIGSFKTPSLPPPRLIPRRPLSGIMSSNMPISPPPPPQGMTTASRLKRLSLVAGPSSVGMIRDESGGISLPSTPIGGPSTPRRSAGVRSSISYSPALNTPGSYSVLQGMQGKQAGQSVQGVQGGRGSFDLPTPRSSHRGSFEEHTKDGSGDVVGSKVREGGESTGRREGKVQRKKGETLLEK